MVTVTDKKDVEVELDRDAVYADAKHIDELVNIHLKRVKGMVKANILEEFLCMLRLAANRANILKHQREEIQELRKQARRGKIYELIANTYLTSQDAYIYVVKYIYAEPEIDNTYVFAHADDLHNIVTTDLSELRGGAAASEAYLVAVRLQGKFVWSVLDNRIKLR